MLTKPKKRVDVVIPNIMCDGCHQPIVNTPYIARYLVIWVGHGVINNEDAHFCSVKCGRNWIKDGFRDTVIRLPTKKEWEESIVSGGYYIWLDGEYVNQER